MLGPKSAESAKEMLKTLQKLSGPDSLYPMVGDVAKHEMDPDPLTPLNIYFGYVPRESYRMESVA